MRRLARRSDGELLVGDDDGFVPLDAVAPAVRTVDDALRAAATGDIPGLESGTAPRIRTSDIAFASPVTDPGKLWGIGLNYAEHAADLDEQRPEEPASFLKPRTALTGPGGPIRLPPAEISDGVTAEAELAVVIGRTCKDIPVDRVESVIAGYMPVIDMTAEDILRRNPRFLTRSKSFDTFLVMGPNLVIEGSEKPLEGFEVRTIINDEQVAANRIENMLFPPDELVSFHSKVMTLEPGDVISTGTPGAGRIRPGDTVRAEIDEIGSVEAPVRR